MMTRKHYQALAEAIAEPTEDYGAVALAHQLAAIIPVLHSVSKVLKADNPRFDKNRFCSAFRDAVGEEKIEESLEVRKIMNNI